MATKVRELIKALLDAGYTEKPCGNGSHRKFYHPGVPPVIICGHVNDDAKRYLEKQVKQAIEAVKGAGE